jgi:hypothetical protein
MSTPPQKASSDQPSLGELVAIASRDMSLLVHQEMELAKAELKQSAVSAGLGAGFLAVAGGLGFFALLAITVAIAEAITQAGGIDRYWSYAIVAGGYLVLAGLLALFAKNRLSRLSPPARTLRTVKDDVAWIKHPTVAPTTSAPAGH